MYDVCMCCLAPQRAVYGNKFFRSCLEYGPLESFSTEYLSGQNY